MKAGMKRSFIPNPNPIVLYLTHSIHSRICHVPLVFAACVNSKHRTVGDSTRTYTVDYTYFACSAELATKRRRHQ